MNWNDSKNIKAYLLPIAIFIVLSVSIGFGLHTHTDEFILFNDLAFKHPNFVLNNSSKSLSFLIILKGSNTSFICYNHEI